MNKENAKGLLRILLHTWGYKEFRPFQLQAVQAILRKQDVLLILPTGGGKSLTFQMPALVQEHGVTVVVCPLIALAKDQAERCLDVGIDTAIWNSDTSETQRTYIESELCSETPSLKLVYTCPEGLRVPRFAKALQEAYTTSVLLSFAIDECHCICTWGHDFRPAYLALQCLRIQYPSVPIIAVTASATPSMEESICKQLNLRDTVVLKQSFNRPNLQFSVRNKELIGDGSDADVLQDLIEFIRGRPGECGIIYCQLRKTCDRLASELSDADVDVAAYHAGKEVSQRHRTQRDWAVGDTQIICATIAFGMGIDKPDVAWVVHYNPSKSIEGYYQEAGRAGRDNRPAACILYSSKQDLEELHKLEKRSRAGSVGNVASYVGPACRRKSLLGFLGEKRGCCLAGEELCDFCQNSRAVLQAERTLEARWAVTSIAAQVKLQQQAAALREASSSGKEAFEAVEQSGQCLAAINASLAIGGSHQAPDRRTGLGKRKNSPAEAWKTVKTLEAAPDGHSSLLATEAQPDENEPHAARLPVATASSLLNTAAIVQQQAVAPYLPPALMATSQQGIHTNAVVGPVPKAERKLLVPQLKRRRSGHGAACMPSNGVRIFQAGSKLQTENFKPPRKADGCI